MLQNKRIPRGIRNNNPLNIRIGNTWLGERPNPTDPAFEEFVSMKYGYRAAFLILRRYIRRYKKDTVPAIISTWAPSSENNTQKYIDVVCAKMGIQPDFKIDFDDEETMIGLIKAMAEVECGQTMPIEPIIEAYKCS